MKRNLAMSLSGIICVLVLMSSINSVMAAIPAQYFPIAGTENKYRYHWVGSFDGEKAIETQFNVYNLTSMNATRAFPKFVIENVGVDLTGFELLVADTTIDIVICYSQALETTLYRYAKVILKDRTITHGNFSTLMSWQNTTSWGYSVFYTDYQDEVSLTGFLQSGFKNLIDYFDQDVNPGDPIVIGISAYKCNVLTSTNIIATWGTYMPASGGANITWIADLSGRVVSVSKTDWSYGARFKGYDYYGYCMVLDTGSSNGGGLDIPGYDIFAIFSALIIGFGAIYAFSLRRKSRMN